LNVLMWVNIGGQRSFNNVLKIELLSLLKKIELLFKKKT